MFRTLILIFLFCGLTVLSVVLEYRATAETSTCPGFPRVCVPDVQPPDCKPPTCEVKRPLLHRSCEHTWRKHLIGDTIRCPQSLCFVFEDDNLHTVARVSTLDIMRAIGR